MHDVRSQEQNVAGLAVNRGFCFVPFQEALSTVENKVILLPPPLVMAFAQIKLAVQMRTCCK